MIGSSRRLLGSALIIVAFVGGLFAVGRLLSPGLRHPSRPAPSSTGSQSGLAHPTTTDSAVVATISLGLAEPVDAVAVSPRAVWAVQSCAVWRVDPKTNLVGAKVVGTGQKFSCAVGLAFGAGAVWATTLSSELLRIDPIAARVVARVPVGPTTASVGTDDTSVWVVCCGLHTEQGRGSLTRVDAASNRVVTRVPLRGMPDAVGAGPSGLWVRAALRSIWRINPATNRVVETIAIPGGLGDERGRVLVGRDGVFIGDPAKNTIIRVDPATGRVAATMVGADGRGVAIVDGTAWATSKAGLMRLDGAPRKISLVAEAGARITDLVGADGTLWASTTRGLIRLDPQRLP
jgi:hypothetical protein